MKIIIIVVAAVFVIAFLFAAVIIAAVAVAVAITIAVPAGRADFQQIRAPGSFRQQLLKVNQAFEDFVRRRF